LYPESKFILRVIRYKSKKKYAVAIQPRLFIYFKGSILNDIAVGKCFINLHSSRILTREATENTGNNNFQKQEVG
jgi:hypothetical protein